MTEPSGEPEGRRPAVVREPAPVLYGTPARRAPTGPVRVVTAGAALVGPRDAALRALQLDAAAARLADGDPTLWGEAAVAEASVRLGWLTLPQTSRDLLPRLAALRDSLRAEGLDRVVLCGMGGSSLAPEVICATAGVPLVVLDTTDAGQVRAALTELDRTVVVVSSKSGSTVETDSQRRILTAALRDAGLSDHDVALRFVAVTDPGSDLAATAEREGWRATFLADPDVGGRYSALSAFGLVPSGLAGADVTALLDDAAAAQADLAADDGNPGLELGAALGGCAAAGRDKVVIADGGSGLVGFGDWAEQLIAESTGKAGRGILPVVVESWDAAGTKHTATGDTHQVRLGRGGPNTTTVTGPLGAQFLVWEYAVAVACRVIGVNPFDQPDVESAKTSTRALLEGGSDDVVGDPPVLVEGSVEIHADHSVLASAASLHAVVDYLPDLVPATGYVAVMAYLDRVADADAAALRRLLAERTGRPVTFGWGPRFLHSTGQLHKGGAPVGVFVQLTGATSADDDVDVPGREFTLARLQMAQALGDGRVLAEHGRPVLRLHLTDRAAGVRQLLDALTPAPAGAE
ncbi:MAG TPA: glucose-6-phosphate isomerase [Mycobacteriales bacterium]|nr:glucose-6-phosphate isomerase [Mycobacteriales bacterium]